MARARAEVGSGGEQAAAADVDGLLQQLGLPSRPESLARHQLIAALASIRVADQGVTSTPSAAAAGFAAFHDDDARAQPARCLRLSKNCISFFHHSLTECIDLLLHIILINK